MTVLEAVAEAKETDPATLPPLYDFVDPDALDALFTGQASGTVVFEYLDYTVSIQANDIVVLQK